MVEFNQQPEAPEGSASSAAVPDLRFGGQMFRALVECASDIIFTLDPGGILTYATPSWREILGVDVSTVVGLHFSDLLHPDDLPAVAAVAARVLHHGETIRAVEYRVRHADGTWRWHSSDASPLLDKGVVVGLVGIGHDVTEHRCAEQALRESEFRYRMLADYTNDVVWTMSPAGAITYISPSVERLRGFTPEEATRQSLEEILTPASQADVLAYFGALQAAIAAGCSGPTYHGEQEYRCKDGSTIWCDVSVVPHVGPDGQVLEVMGVSRDITRQRRYEDGLREARDEAETANRALREANEQLLRHASTDALTGAANRRRFTEVLEVEMANATRYAHPSTMLMFDIDHFKAINDTFGHHAGDAVLVETTARVRRSLRVSDVLARWGGEEFVVLMPHTRVREGGQVAEKLRRIIADAPFPSGGTVTISLGVAEYTPGQTADAWLRRVDDALYRAKAEGRNAVGVANPVHPGEAAS